MADNNYIGNISTIIKIVSMTISGWILTTLTAQGYNLGVDAVTLASVIGAVIGLGFSIIDARYPNTFKCFDNAVTPLETEETVLNPEYETGADDNDSC